jgi:LacI family transcriptional regulator
VNVTIKHVAARAGVSTATVSRVINNDDRISRATRDRVQRAIGELGYTVNTIARSLKSKRTRSIGLLAPQIANVFFMRVAEGVEDRLAEDGYSMIVVNARESVEREQSALQLLVEKQVDGIIAIPFGQRGDHIVEMHRSGLPFVLVDRLVPGYEGDAVLVDNHDATYSAIRRLIQLGRRRFGFIGGRSHITTARERHEGFEDALAEYGIPVEARHVRFGDFDEESGYRLMEAIVSTADPPDTVMLANYFSHIGALRFVGTHRDDVPRSLYLAAFDDTTLSSVIGIPSITIEQPIDLLGRRAAEIILGRLAGETDTPATIERLTTTLVEHNVAP